MDDVRVGARRDARQGGHDARTRTSDVDPAPTVLVADHDEAARGTLVSTLEAAGMRVLEAGSLAECLASVQLLHLDALVVARDLADPSSDDPVAAIRATDDGDGLAILLLADTDQADSVRDGLRTGADDVVARPFDPAEVLARVRARLRQRSVWLSRLERRRATHAVVVDTLARAQVDGDAGDAAALVCRTVRRLPDVGFVAVLGIEPNGRVAPLAAVAGDDTPVEASKLLSPRQARALLERTRAGAWIARADEVLPGIGGRVPETLVCAAVRDRGALVAVLVIGAAGSAATAPHTGRLTMATELAAVATGCLAPALEADAQSRQRGRLADVIAGRAFQVVFQPVVDLSDRSRVGIEASVRYDDGVAEAVRLDDAQRLGLAAELDVAVLEAVAATSGRLPSDCWVSVNVSPRQLGAGGAVLALLESIDRPLVVELTERERVDDYAALRTALRTLGRRAQVAVDHVGSGYASLRHVLALHPAFVKLDEAWVRDIDQDAARQALVAGLGYFATYTGCRLVGTGVQSEHEAEALAGLGVALGQGPLFGTPRALRRRATGT